MKKREYTATSIKRGNKYIAWINEIPGVNTQGKTLAETKRNLEDALRMVLRENRKISKQAAGSCEQKEFSITVGA